MMTLRLFSAEPSTIPTIASWYLADLSKARGKPFLKNRDEEEVRGYRDALRLIHEKAWEIAISEDTILKFHKLSRGQIRDAKVPAESKQSRSRQQLKHFPEHLPSMNLNASDLSLRKCLKTKVDIFKSENS